VQVIIRPVAAAVAMAIAIMFIMPLVRSLVSIELALLGIKSAIGAVVFTAMMMVLDRNLLREYVGLIAHTIKKR